MGHRSGPAGGRLSFPCGCVLSVPPGVLPWRPQGVAPRGVGRDPGSISDSRPMSPGAAVPGCRRAWCPHERVHPSPASWPPPRGPAERAGGCVLTWGFLCWGLGPFLKTPPPSWCCPVRTLTCLQKRHRWGWAHGLCGESRREGPGELEAEREDSSQEGCKQRCCCCSPLPGPLHPPPKKRKPPGGEEGRQIPPSCSARTHVETQGRTPAACRLPELSGLVP